MRGWQRWVLLGALASWAAASAQVSGEFALKVVRLQGQGEVLADAASRPLRTDAVVHTGETLRVVPNGVVVVQWLPYKALVKVESGGQVRLSPHRVLQVGQGRVWIGTPPPPPGERRYPLPVQCGAAQLVGSPDAFFSVAVRRDRHILISVDEGSVFVTVGNFTTTVRKGQMAFVTPQNAVIGPLPMSRDERLRWDMGGVR
ncbi:hypothetical protein HRbin17_01823 [bacterium HR17]|uniref:FecR protein domain-containing protein n=1 Tax=Candidatus Fervidibacter japonicus TaxID=2035412 RepID=A0A2H5XDN5_9BACT|nr:hypothetical protein HRbin17_01823 [bacterium HR17]